MNIEGTYKIDIELTARKQVEGLVATTRRLLGQISGRMPQPSDLERQVESVVEQLQQDQALFDSFTMTIDVDHISVKTDDGQTTYHITRKMQRDDSHIELELHNEEMGAVAWNVSLIGAYLLIDSIDGMSEYAFKRK